MLSNAVHTLSAIRLVTRAPARRQTSSLVGKVCGTIFLVLLLSSPVLAQSSPQDAPEAISEPTQQSHGLPKPNQQSPSNTASTTPDANSTGTAPEAKQTKRILWVFPNYRSVSADTKLPPLSTKEKFWLATQDSFDYSSFITAAMIAGVGQAHKAYPELGQGAEGYARYFWRAVADQAVGNYFTEALVPVVTHEDPRYYTLGHGGVFKRTGYAMSRLLVTRTDSGRHTFNISEIVGNGAAAGISNTYYPAEERTWTKTGQKWATQIALDGFFNVVKEFWPDVNRAVFHGKY